MDVKERLVSRFGADKARGLADIKFFVHGSVSVNDLYDQADRYLGAIAAGPCKEISEIDKTFPKTPFNAPFE